MDKYVKAKRGIVKITPLGIAFQNGLVTGLMIAGAMALLIKITL